MTDFSTPFFFAYTNVNEDGADEYTVVNNHDPYQIFCLVHEIAYWLRYHTHFRDGKLYLGSGLHAQPSVTFSDRYNGMKSISLIKVSPVCDDAVQLKIRELIERFTDVYKVMPCLIMDSSIHIWDDLGCLIPSAFVKEALTLIKCQPSLVDTDLKTWEEGSQHQTPPVKHYVVHDEFTVRLYALINDRDSYDNRTFNEVYDALLNETIDQIKDMWNNGFVIGAQSLINDWPLVDMGNGWFRHQSYNTAVVDRFMTPLNTFYQSRLQGNNIIRCKLSRNYAIFYEIARSLNAAGYSFRFLHNYLEVVVANFRQCEEINTIVEYALLTRLKVILHQGEHPAGHVQVTYCSIDLVPSSLIVIPPDVISSKFMVETVSAITPKK